MDFDWQNFLVQFNKELLSDDEIRLNQLQEVLDSNWLGFSGALEDEIKSAESRLDIELPPSYRRFLKASNGWRNCGHFIYKIWSTNEIAWFKERNQNWIDAYVAPYLNSLPKVPDNTYFIYGEEQDAVQFRLEYLQTALEISDIGDSAIYLLNPKVITKEGEWEAWFFANWHAGAVRYRSFQELMEAERKSFLRLSK